MKKTIHTSIIYETRNDNIYVLYSAYIQATRTIFIQLLNRSSIYTYIYIITYSMVYYVSSVVNYQNGKCIFFFANNIIYV